MTAEQRRRHNVRSGLNGLAQVRGRNAISWEGKLATDLIIVLRTVSKFLRREDIVAEGMATVDDCGDTLLKYGKVSQEVYDSKQLEAKTFTRILRCISAEP